MITKEKIAQGLKSGVIRLAIDPNMESGTVCFIGSSWFYFGGETAAEMNPHEFLKAVPQEDVVNEIYDTLQEFAEDEDLGDEYLYCDAILDSMIVSEDSTSASREFYVDTPMGKLKVYAKHKKDTPEDFPGIFVDFVGEDEDICLSCTEYDSAKEEIYTHVYGDANDDSPTDSIRHKNLNPSEHFDRNELADLLGTLVQLSYRLPPEEECSNQEIDLCGDICNLRESIQNYFKKISR